MLNTNTTVRRPPAPYKGGKLPCLECTGLGERDPTQCNHRRGTDGPRRVIRAVFDGDGRWLVQWREADGEEWVGTYRLLPC